MIERLSPERAGLVLHAVLAVAGLLVLAVSGMSWGMDRPELLPALVAIAVVCELSEVWLSSGVRLNATLAAAVLALAVAGPVGAFLVLAVPDLAVWALRRDERLLRAGTLANLAAYPWAALAGAAVLALAHAPGTDGAALPLLAAAGLALAVANFAVGPAIYAPLQLGAPARAMPGELAGALPAVVAMVLTGVVTAALIPALGFAALGGFALATLVPPSALTRLARARPVSDLDRLEATRRYADALADVLCLPERDRHVLAEAAALSAVRPDPWSRLTSAATPVGHPDPDASEIAETAAFAAEAFEGGGQPSGVGGTLIPELSRVLAVAESWAGLTARDTATLSHVEALLALEARSGTRFDPDMVAAAGTLVERDLRFAALPAAQPRLHAWRGSAALRQRFGPRLLELVNAA